MRNSGFTIFELMVALAILLLVLGVTAANFGSFTKKQRLAQAGLTFKEHLRLAQAKAISAEKPGSGCNTLVGYRLSFSSSSYTVQAECSDGVANPTASVSLPSGITFFPIPEPFTFRVLVKTIDTPGVLTLILTNGTNNYRINLSPSGDITVLGLE